MIYDVESLEHYRNSLLNLEIESYIGRNVKKITLEKYKNMYVSMKETRVSKKLGKSCDVYNDIFKPIFHSANLHYSEPA